MGRAQLRTIALTSLGVSTTAVVLLATAVQTADASVFNDFRAAFASLLAHPYGFWAFIFLILTAFVLIGLLLFNYDRRTALNSPILSRDGVLLFDREQHIAFSIRTLKSLLLKLSGELPEGRAREILFAAGVAAGQRFGSSFQAIYAERIEADHLKPWSRLSDHEKLEAWERYDGTAGWGRISARIFRRKGRLEIDITHPTLFADEGGAVFSWLLIGYCREVASAILGKSLTFNGECDVEFDDEIVCVSYFYS
jgi:hypothetical protein